jgi:predicted metal-dependent enzyme (double-stranded beta helix superfamily)
MGGRKGEG